MQTDFVGNFYFDISYYINFIIYYWIWKYVIATQKRRYGKTVNTTFKPFRGKTHTTDFVS